MFRGSKEETWKKIRGRGRGREEDWGKRKRPGRTLGEEEEAGKKERGKDEDAW